LNFPIVIMKVAYYWWSVYSHQYVHDSLLCPNHYCQFTSHHSMRVTPFQF
jgi:hypothetical protein